MHQIAKFQENCLKAQHDHIRRNPLATVVSLGSEGLVGNHFPLILTDTKRGKGMLQGHMARANPLWRDFDQTIDVLTIFPGIQQYITPTYYASKAEHEKVVPTWNYTVVHASGPLRIIQDKGWILKHLGELTDNHEKENEVPWSIDDAPRNFIDSQLKGIVGFEIPIKKISGAMKLSQNKNEADTVGIVRGLHAEGSDCGRDMAEIIERNLRVRSDI